RSVRRRSVRGQRRLAVPSTSGGGGVVDVGYRGITDVNHTLDTGSALNIPGAKAGAALIVHGGLTLPPGGRHTEGFVQRARVDARAKARVARACARLVGPQDRVLIDAGTTAYEVARVLASSFEGTLITHSAPVIQLALRMPRVTTIALGGELL